MMSGVAAPAELERAWEETNGFHAYLAERFQEALGRPRDDVMGDLAGSVQAGESTNSGLAHWEALAILFQLVVGGIETAVGLIGAAIRHAAQETGLWRKLRETPASVPSLVEEALRLDGPAIGNHQRTTHETKLAGVLLPEGSTLSLLWGSANRDEARFPEPDRFVLDRPNI